jgi:hypothetical protein
LIVCFGVWALASCKTIQPNAPSLKEIKLPPTSQPVSTINIPISVDLNPFFKMAEDSMPKEFSGEEHPCEGVRYAYTFNRNPFGFSGNGNILNLHINGQYKLSGSYCSKCVFDKCLLATPSFSCGVNEPMRKISIGYQSEINILPNYIIQTKTSLDYLTPIDPCKISFLKYQITDKLIEAIKPPLKDLAKKVDQETAKFKLKDYVQNFWNTLSADQPIGEIGFLHLNPQELSVSKLNMKGSDLTFNLGVQCRPDITIRPKLFEKKTIPNLIKPTEAKGFNIALDIHAPYHELSELLNKQFANTVYNVSGKKIIIDEIKVLGSELTKIVLILTFSGSKKGIVYLEGTPQINTKNNKITIPDLSFNLQSKNLLLKMADWFFEGKITEKIKAAATIDYTAQINTAKANLQDQLNKKIAEGMLLKGNVKALNISDIYPMKNELLIRTYSTGDISLQVK